MKTHTSLRNLIEQAFERRPDPAAGIIQGVRYKRRGRPHAWTVLFPSPKNGGSIPCEGRLEEEAALCFEQDPTIDEYRGQPIAMPGPKGKPVVPDFALRRGHFFAIVDIKPKGQLLRASVNERMRWIRKELGAVGIPHYIITEHELQAQPWHQIRRKLQRGHIVRLKKYQARLLKEMVQADSTTVADVRRKAVELGVSPYVPEKLALLGQLTFPINAPWRETTLLGVNNDEHNRTLTAGWGTVHDLRLPL